MMFPADSLGLVWHLVTWVSGLNRQESGRGNQAWEAVDVEESMWSLDADEDVQGEAIKALMVSLVKPPLTETEVTWKKGACCS